MFPTLVKTVFVFVLPLAARHAAAAQLSISTPTLVQCQDTVISYSGGQANYALYILPSGEPCADSLVEIPEQTKTSYTWKVNLPAGGIVEIMVADATTTEAWSGIITVQNSSDASCVDRNATKALIAANSLPKSSSSAPSITPPIAVFATSSPTFKLSTTPGATGAGKTVTPANPTLANAAGSSPSSLPSSGFPRTALPTCSLLGVATILLAAIRLI